MSLAVCPGSFDPVTLGHLDVVRRAAGLFDEVVVAVVANPAKRGLFGPGQRAELVRASLACLAEQGPAGRVVVDVVEGGLLVEWARARGATALVKGLRGGTDYDYELPMALMNRHLTGLETVFVPGDPALAGVSSSLVREVAGHGGDVSALVPGPVWEALRTATA